LLGAAGEVLLTSMPTPYSATAPRRLTLKDAEATKRQERVGGELTLEIEPAAVDAHDAWVHISLTSDGEASSIELGPAAVAIHP